MAMVVVRPRDYPTLLVRRNVISVLGRPNRATLEPAVAAMARGELKVPIERRVPLRDAEEAHRVSRAGKVVGKLLLIP